MTVPAAGTETGNAVVVVMPEGNCTEVSIAVKDVFVLALTVVEKLAPGEMLSALGDALSER